MTEQPKLAGKTAVVVGFANSAGREIARALAETGANLGAAAASLDGDEVMEAKRAARDAIKLGRSSFSQAWDVTLPTNVQVSLKQLIKELGRPSILVYNVSTSLDAQFARTTDAQLAHVHATVLHHGLGNGSHDFGWALGEHRCVGVVLTLEDGQREPRMGAHVANAGRAAERGKPERLGIDGEQRGGGVRTAVGPGGGRERVGSALQVLR